MTASVLRHFATTQREAASGLPALVLADAAVALRRAHDLKGMLGNLGAQALFADADRLCDLLRNTPCDTAAAQASARRLEGALPRICDDIFAALPAPAPTPADPRCARARDADAGEDFHQELAHLAGYLRRGRAREAKAAVSRLRGLTADDAGRALLEELAPLVSGYRLREALALLEQHHHG
jgi:HPt (histidine-containing phosphotransfer) domain-containing protein